MNAIEESARNLVNPASGIANDYLNSFNEILLLLENLTVLLPEMVEELLNWRPVSYVDYFSRSNLPGSAEALLQYHALPSEFRAHFTCETENLAKLALAAIDVLRREYSRKGELDPAGVGDFCTEASRTFRISLQRVTELVNNGSCGVGEQAQAMANRLMMAEPA